MKRSITFKHALIILPLVVGIGLLINASRQMDSHPIFSGKKFAEAPLVGIEIASEPYQTTFSLGDELLFNGLSIKAIYEDASEDLISSGYVLEGGDSLQLGKQTVTINYQNALTSFDIDITNLGAIVVPLEAKDLFISEIVNDREGFSAIEIYNGSGSLVSYLDYQLLVYDGEVLTTLELPDLVRANETLIIVNDDSALINSNTATLLVDETFDLTSIDRIVLYDKANLKALDTIDLSLGESELITQDGLLDLNDYHMIRDRKTVRPSNDFHALDWYFGNGLDSLGIHELASPTINIEAQAVAYGKYVMYGIGMNAASDPFGAFNRLRDEYNYMHPQTKQYFLENKRHEISGINESGKLVTNTFNDAIGRYNYLASRTGNPGLTSSSSTLNLDWGEIGKISLFAGIIVIAAGAYILIKRKFGI